MELKKDEMMKRFRKMEPGLFDTIVSVQALPEMVAAVKKLEGFETQLKEIREKLDKVDGRASVSSADGRALLDGGSLDSLSGSGAETKGQQLMRQKNALQRAIEIQKAVIRDLTRKLAQKGCEKIESFAKKYETTSITAFEKLVQALQNKEIFYGFLNLRGYSPGFRPAEWSIIPYEIKLLNDGIPHIAQRRKIWGLDGKTKQEKKVS